MKAIQSAYDAQTDAYNRKDAEGVLARCSPQYEDDNGDSVDHRDKYSNTIRTVLKLVESCVARATVKSATCETSDRCEAIVDRHFEFHLPPSSKDGVRDEMVTDETNKDIWEKDAVKGWLKRRSVVLQSKTTNDGKPDS